MDKSELLTDKPEAGIIQKPIRWKDRSDWREKPNSGKAKEPG